MTASDTTTPEATGDRRGDVLRARRRLRMETEIEEIALELFAQRGFEDVTIDEIADAAAISRRTFFRCFGSKEELLLRGVRRRVDRFIEAFGARPVDEPLLEALRAAVLETAEGYEADRDALVRLERIIADAPGVLARSIGEPTALMDTIIGMVAVRLDTDPAADMRPAIIANSVVFSGHVALQMWLHRPGSDYPALAAQAFDLAVDGLAAAIASSPVRG
jgi:AcrR family transcriptional regulator